MTKADAIKTVVQCASLYKEKYVGNNLLFICYSKESRFSWLEVSFHKGNFLHLTGLKLNSSISANDFFSRCLSKRLKESDFDLSKDGTTVKKLAVLPTILSSKHLSANMIGDYNKSKPCLYTEKIAGNVRACVGFVDNSKRTECVPNTVLEIDGRSLMVQCQRVVEVYRKPFHAPLYEQCVYRCKDFASFFYLYPIDIIKKLNPFIQVEDIV